MATIQARKSRGHTYWYLVESRRVNGKPRPITLAYLGKPDDLLKRLQGAKPFSIQSFTHGDVRALLDVAEELEIVDSINAFVPPGRGGTQPLRDGLTVGGSLLLAALGRACQPTSKRGWAEWARGTSLETLLQVDGQQLTSQHFWDQMEALPVSALSQIEERMVQTLLKKYPVTLDLLLLDATNFFTFIDSTNSRCTIPQRGKNKQRRLDLRQVGLALLVTRTEQLPLFHYTYRGNQPDVTVFREVFGTVSRRLARLTQELEQVTIVFDKGNNSKANLKQVEESGLHYVGSLVPAYHRELLERANRHWTVVDLKGKQIPVYREKREVWGTERTVVVAISEELRQGQLRGIQQVLRKAGAGLEELKGRLEAARRRRRRGLSREQLEARIEEILQGEYLREIVWWKLKEAVGGVSLEYGVDQKKLEELADKRLGRRILMTDRHNWSTEEILRAYRSQTKVEEVFRHLKNPFHGAFQPSYHWTDQKLQVHAFTCVLAYLLMMVILLKAKEHAGYQGSLHGLMEKLKTIRLAALVETKEGRRGRAKVDYRLEDLPEEIGRLAQALNITNERRRSALHVGVYKTDSR